jgi:hypothetical protein
MRGTWFGRGSCAAMLPMLIAELATTIKITSDPGGQQLTLWKGQQVGCRRLGKWKQ